MKIKKMTPRHILVLLLMVTPLCGQAQTRQNYVKKTTYLDENQMNGIVSYQYYDGLGRPSETATNGMGTDGKYVYTMTTYDQDGREAKKYQASVGGTTAEYQTEAELKPLSRALMCKERTAGNAKRTAQTPIQTGGPRKSGLRSRPLNSSGPR